MANEYRKARRHLAVFGRVFEFGLRVLYRILGVFAKASILTLILTLIYVTLPGGPVHDLATMVHGEAKHQSKFEKLAIIGTAFFRTDSRGEGWPNTLQAVLWQPERGDEVGESCLYRAMCDSLQEDLSTQEGKKNLQIAFLSWIDWQLGNFWTPIPGAHSYATPRAVRTHNGYFGTLAHFETEYEFAHQFFGKPVPVPVPAPRSEAPAPKKAPVAPVRLSRIASNG